MWYKRGKKFVAISVWHVVTDLRHIPDAYDLIVSLTVTIFLLSLGPFAAASSEKSWIKLIYFFPSLREQSAVFRGISFSLAILSFSWYLCVQSYEKCFKCIFAEKFGCWTCLSVGTNCILSIEMIKWGAAKRRSSYNINT